MGELECMDPSRMYERELNVWTLVECMREGLNVWGLRSVMLCSTLPSGYSQPGWVAKGWNVVIQEVTGGVQQGLTLGHCPVTDGHWEEHFGPKCGTPQILGHH